MFAKILVFRCHMSHLVLIGYLIPKTHCMILTQKKPLSFKNDTIYVLTTHVYSTDGGEVISGSFDMGRALDFLTLFFLTLGNKIWYTKRQTTSNEL